MLFNSLEFILFFLIVFILYWFVLHKKLKHQNLLLLASSYLFYGWWDWRFLSLIIISSVVDYYLGIKIFQSNNDKRRKRLLFISLAVNLGFLGFFKYCNFFIDSFVNLLAQFNFNIDTYTLNIILPVGISFYTFQTLSYSIDIYKRKMEPTRNAISFFTFVAFFPQLVAGPIERAKNLLPQFSKKREFNYQLARSGGRLVLLGFFKKIVVADSLAVLVNAVYNNPEGYAGIQMIIATVFFAFQIYCDFSGYSDIAIGISRFLGFNLMTNFRTPYFSKSLTDFWRRWHISLSTWFKDYVYIPLGGSRGTSFRVGINLFITFLVSGLWHGANWTFIAWGAIHGIILIIEKYFNKRVNIQNNVFTRVISIIYTFLIVCFAWIFFRSNSISDAFYIINNMFSDSSQWFDLLAISLKFRGMGLTMSDLVYSILFTSMLITIELGMKSLKIKKVIGYYNTVRWAIYLSMLFLIIFSFTKNSAANFIYFQF